MRYSEGTKGGVQTGNSWFVPTDEKARDAGYVRPGGSVVYGKYTPSPPNRLLPA
jgi:hypothetical protein